MSEKEILIKKRIDSELNYKRALYIILDLCKDKISLEQLDIKMELIPEIRDSAQSSIVLLMWLIDCEALVQSQENESIHLQISQEGLNVLEKEKQEDKLGELLEEESNFISIYKNVLSICKNGKSRKEIEKIIENNSLIQKPKIYPSYFIDNLEKVGGLIWNEKWFTSQKGLAKLLD